MHSECPGFIDRAHQDFGEGHAVLNATPRSVIRKTLGIDPFLIFNMIH